MEFSVKSGTPEKQRTGCIVAGVFESRKLSAVAHQIDEVSGGAIGAILRRGDLEGKAGQTLLLHNIPNLPSERVLLVGGGKEKEFNESRYRDATAKAVSVLKDTGTTEITSYLTEIDVKGRDIAWKVRQAVEVTEAALYRFDQLKSKPNNQRRALRRVVLVGKGLPFDAGGISIKPAANMDEMKFDMCGGASVLGAMKAAAELKLPLNIVGIVPSSENLPDGDANKPGDIVTSMSGQTVEVLNTDAEGRLILSDALTYAERYNPAAVIDIATLTGACVIALGAHASGLLANNDQLAREIINAGKYTHDRAWQLPLWDEYQKQLDSNFADMANIGGPG